MKSKFPLSLCTIAGWYNLSLAQSSPSGDTSLIDKPNPEDTLNPTLEAEHFLSQSIFSNPYIIPDGQSFFDRSTKDDKELQSLKTKYFSLSLPLAHIRITSRFGMRNHPVLKECRNHLGVDLKASFQPAYAMMPGKVERVGSDNASGNFVVCTHGKYTVYYYHLSQIKVKPGQRIKAGDIIGITGNTGRSTGPHLHLGVQFCGTYIDPMVLLVKIQRTKISLLRSILEHTRAKE